MRGGGGIFIVGIEFKSISLELYECGTLCALFNIDLDNQSGGVALLLFPSCLAIPNKLQPESDLKATMTTLTALALPLSCYEAVLVWLKLSLMSAACLTVR
jgi:hypothetical protein